MRAMSKDDHREPGHPDLLGALVMGLLDPDEAAAVESHVAQCADCRGERAAMTTVRERLDAVPGHEVLAEYDRQESVGTADPSDDVLLQRVLREMRGTSERKPPSRMRRVATAVAVIAAIGGVGAVVGRVTAPEPPPGASSTAGAQVFQHTEKTTGVGARVQVIPAPGSGVRLRISVTGAPQGQTGEVYAVATDGRRKLVASWVVRQPPSEESVPVMDGTAAFSAEQILRFEVTDPTGKLWCTVST